MNYKPILRYGVLILILGVIFLSAQNITNANYVLGEKIEIPASHATFFNPPPPVDSSKIFPTATDCVACHGFDPNGNALVDFFGNDVNIYDDWVPTMMGMAAKDPLWRAKVSHETTVNPEHKEALETVCTSCHAPMGHYNAMYGGAEHYTIAEMLADTIALDGVSCAVCHKMSSTDIGDHNSGFMVFDTARVMYGPYPGPFEAPMELYTGFTPAYGPHINDAGVCASCHTLITNSVDLEGEPTGNKFVEQATYHEWLNSKYNDDNVTCQACHMPRLEEPVIISSDNKKIEPRAPFALHDLVGANTFMLKLMKDNRDTLDLAGDPEDFDETIAKTFTMLKTKSIDLEVGFHNFENDTAFFSVHLLNKAGHKFPSGYPSRRAYIEFVMTSLEGDTLFHSGKLDEHYELLGHDANYEPHYDVITEEGQVQIYQLVPVDVNGDFTTILERGDTPAKDNRLPPIGFTTDDVVYDTTLIAGTALADLNFNKNTLGEEGTGRDVVYYNIPMNGYSGEVEITARVHYQALPPRWVSELFEVNTPEIELFKEMFFDADREPVMVKEEVLGVVLFVDAINDPALDGYLVYPNPAVKGKVQFLIPDDSKVLNVEVYDLKGQLVKSEKGDVREISVNGSGLYVLKIETDKGVVTRKIVF
jgi:hypothetical protein